MKVLALLPLLGIQLSAQEPSLGEREREYLHQALRGLSIEPHELGFEKKWAIDTLFRVPVVDRMLDRPLELPGYGDSSARIMEELKEDPVSLLSFMALESGVKIRPDDTRRTRSELLRLKRGFEAELKGLPEELASPLGWLLAGLKFGDEALRDAIKELSSEELDHLLLEAPVLWGDEDDSTDDHLKGELHREFGVKVDTTYKLELDTLLGYAKRFDISALVRAGIGALISVVEARTEIAGLDPTQFQKLEHSHPEIEGSILYYAETELGKVVIGGDQDNRYRDDYALILDLGGDDWYQGRVGGAVGVLGSSASLLLDLSGDDRYDSEKLFNLGSGLFGVGILHDLTGDDSYQGFHYTQGSGLFGIGVLLDDGGDDIYDAGYFAQGAAHFGLGLLKDRGGNDSYRAYSWAQGMGSTRGYGSLADHKGNDSYYTGGRYLHYPLLPHDHRSFAQGFGMGFRPDASGGIGFLYDGMGNDSYDVEVYGQGTSYWYSLGILFDKAGNDRYSAVKYAQGAGIHLSVGLLIDRTGDDSYYSRHGPGQGEGHDLSVGMLIDKSGNDSYQISGGQGIGLTNSFGLFIDSKGEDLYTTTEPLGQGSANPARGYGGAGIFLDLGGKDSYPRSGLSDNSIWWFQGHYGVGLDLAFEPEPEEEVPELEPVTPPRPIEEVFKEASLWEVGEAIPRVRRGRKELIERGGEAIPYICKEKLSTKSGLELRAIEELAKALPDSILPCLYKGLSDERARVRANSIYLLGKIGRDETVDSLLKALKDPRNRPRWAISALGEMKATRVAPILTPYLKTQDEPTRLAAAKALSELKHPETASALIKALNDEYFTVRLAAENAIVALGDTAISPLLSALETAQETPAVHIISALGRIAETLDPESSRRERILIKEPLLARLKAPNPAIRGAAVEALGRFKDEMIKETLRQYEASELDDSVRARYRQTLK